MKLDQIKGIPIIDVAKLLGICVKNNKSRCPLGTHEDKIPSFSIKEDTNTWKCFGCNEGGSNIDLVAKVLNIGFNEAVEWLMCSYNMDSSKLKRKAVKGSNVQQKKLFYRTETYDIQSAFYPKGSDNDIYEKLLELCPITKKGTDYLEKRGFSAELIKNARIGELEAPKETWAKLITLYGVKRLLNCGIAKKKDNKATLVWWDRSILFPFLYQEKVVYIQGRRFNHTKGPKYINLSGLSKPMYNSEVLKKIKIRSKVLILEGVPDTLAAIGNGYNAVGILGVGSFRDSWISLFADYNIIIVFDMDEAGKKGASKLTTLFSKGGKIVRVAKLNEGQDLEEYLRSKKRRHNATK
ncbi:MAG TPA: CHC2 zinc finger domain-containing protein [archaeon]|nr:CHC2 zinc finger domain-containing protein [archaeon]